MNFLNFSVPNSFSSCISIAFHSTVNKILMIYKNEIFHIFCGSTVAAFFKIFFKWSALIDVYFSHISAQQHFRIKKKLILKRINSEFPSVQLRGYPHFKKFQKYQFQCCLSFHLNDSVHFDPQTESRDQQRWDC